jgi:uncharacterized protein (DUF342 family)
MSPENGGKRVAQSRGNIKLKSGITGSELSCGGDLTCRFIENCKISVKGNITAEYILNSDVSCGGNLKTIGNISRIVGGICAVGQGFETKSIGSISNTINEDRARHGLRGGRRRTAARIAGRCPRSLRKKLKA